MNRHSHCESTLQEIALYNNLSNYFLIKMILVIIKVKKIVLEDWIYINNNSHTRSKLYHPLKY